MTKSDDVLRWQIALAEIRRNRRALRSYDPHGYDQDRRFYLDMIALARKAAA